VAKKEQLLSKELIVASEIYRLSEIENTKVYFTKLVDILSKKRKASAATINKSMDILFDLGMIYADWEKLENGRWARVLKIAGESKDFIKGIYEETHE